MDEHIIAKDMERGQRAKELLENPLLLEAFSTIEAEVNDIWKTSKINQPELREESYLTLRAMDRLQAQLHQWLDSGKIATAELEKKTRQSESLTPKV